MADKETKKQTKKKKEFSSVGAQIFVIGFIAFILIIVPTLLIINKFSKDATVLVDNNLQSEVQPEGVTVKKELEVQWKEGTKNALQYVITINNNTDVPVYDWKLELNVNDSTEIKNANACQAVVDHSLVTVLPKGNESIPARESITFNIVFLDDAETAVSGDKLYYNEEKDKLTNTTSENATSNVTSTNETSDENAVVENKTEE